MCRRIMLAIVLLISCMLLCSCGDNHSEWWLTKTFNEAIITLEDGTIVRGMPTRWSNPMGDQIQVEIDGVVYSIHSTNCTLISK